jgi:hypothetical protein
MNPVDPMARQIGQHCTLLRCREHLSVSKRPIRLADAA